MLLLSTEGLTNPNHRRRNDETTDEQKQRRLFSQLESDHFLTPQEQSDELTELLAQEKSDSDQLKDMLMKEL